jgi:hypothetical protein
VRHSLSRGHVCVLSASLLLALATVLVGTARAEVVKLVFSGAYVTEGDTVFGLSGSAVPYRYEITYDTSLDTNEFYFGAGETEPVFVIGDAVTVHPLYCYSESGIISSELKFGTKTWTAENLPVVALGYGGAAAPLWFDADISLATPTRAAISFGSNSKGGMLHLGRLVTDNETATIFLRQDSLVTHYDAFGDRIGTAESSNLHIERTLVPEPSTLLLALAGVSLLGIRRR